MNPSPTTTPAEIAAWPAADWTALRAAGLAYVEQYAHDRWTDYNRHDPGVTILELLCYAITDLSYRTSLPMEDLLASSFGSGEQAEASFLPAHQALPSAPVSELDYRKLFIDVPGVRNAWLLPVALPVTVDPLVTDPAGRLRYGVAPPDALGFQLRGLFDILVEFDPAGLAIRLDGFPNTCSGEEEADDAPAYKIITSDLSAEQQLRQRVLAEVRAAYLAHRNLGEDCRRIIEVPIQYVALCAEVDLLPGASVAEVYAQILLALSQYLAPPVKRYSLAEMQAQRGAAGQPLTVDELYEGPHLDNGFIRDADLQASGLRSHVYGSDIINLLVRIEGVVAIRKLQLNRLKAKPGPVGVEYVYEPGAAGQAWVLTIPPGHQPQLAPTELALSFHKGIVPVGNKPDLVKGRERFAELQRQAAEANCPPRATLPVPSGNVYALDEYRPLAYDFPANYGIGPHGLPAEAPEARRNQARQLKAYLLFFDQLLSNYLGQLAQLREVFGSSPATTHFLRGQLLREADYAGLNELYDDPSETALTRALQDALVDSDPEKPGPRERDLNRLSTFFDHLLARFGEDFSEYGLLMHSLYGTGGTAAVVRDKAAFLASYTDRAAVASRHNGQAYDYSQPAGETPTNLPALVERYGRLFGTRRLTLVEVDSNSDFPEETGVRRYASETTIISVYPTADNQGYFYTLHVPLTRNAAHLVVEPGQAIVRGTYLKSKPFTTRQAAEQALQQTFYRGSWQVETRSEAEGATFLEAGRYAAPKEWYVHCLRDARGEVQAESGNYYPQDGDTQESRAAAREDARKNLDEARRLLIYGGEVLYLVEHLLLRPEEGSHQYELGPDGSTTRSLVSVATYATKAEAERALATDFPHPPPPLAPSEKTVFWELYEEHEGQGQFGFVARNAAGRALARSAGVFASQAAAQTGMENARKLTDGTAVPRRTATTWAQPWQAVCAEPDGTFCEPLDPYSFRVSLVLPGYTTRAQSVDFRRLAEQLLRAELPAHVLARICWVGQDDMEKFERLYIAWSQAKAGRPTRVSREEYAVATDALLKCLRELHTIYPPGVLHDCNSAEEENPIILGRTTLGSGAASPVIPT